VRYLLDTNVWYRGLGFPNSLPRDVLQIVAQRDEQLGISAISLWEIGKKAQLGKLRLSKDIATWLDEALAPQFTVLQIDAKVVAEAMRLPAFPNRDPADELIVATARVHNLVLLTSDRALKNYAHARIHYFKPLAAPGG